MFYWITKVILTPILRVLFRPHVEGLEHVPETGGAILASNHVSFSDSAFLILVVPRRVTFLAKSDYFTGRGPLGRLKVSFFRGLGQVPLDRSGGEASGAALSTALRIIKSRRLLGIYPEGTRSPDGKLYRGKTGVARMALEARVPVVPVAMLGTFHIQPAGRLIPKIAQVGVRIGKPLDFSRYEGLEDDRFVLRSITDEIMYELMVLSGQEYVDKYAADVKADLATAHKAAGHRSLRHHSLRHHSVGQPSVGQPSLGQPSLGQPSLGHQSVGDKAVEPGSPGGAALDPAEDAADAAPPYPEHRRAS